MPEIVKKFIPYLLLGTLVAFSSAALSMVCRPLFIFILKRIANGSNNPEHRLPLAYHTGAGFDEVKPLLDKLSNPLSWTDWFLALAFANARFDEARQYSDYQLQWFDAWLQKNRKMLREGLRLYKEWDDRRFSTDNPLSADKESKLIMKISELDGHRAREWVDAHLIHTLLQWSAQKKDAPAERALRKMNMKRRPHIYENLPFLDELAGKMGMLEADFEGLRKKQEAELERIVYGKP